MPIDYNCPRCDHNGKAKDSMQGKRVKCPSCGAAITLPVEQELRPSDFTFVEPPSIGHHTSDSNTRRKSLLFSVLASLFIPEDKAWAIYSGAAAVVLFIGLLAGVLSGHFAAEQGKLFATGVAFGAAAFYMFLMNVGRWTHIVPVRLFPPLIFGLILGAPVLMGVGEALGTIVLFASFIGAEVGYFLVKQAVAGK